MSKLKTNLNEILQEKQNKIIPENIKKDVQIFDVVGTYEGSNLDTSDATATSEDIVDGKTAYVNGEKITGEVDEVKFGHWSSISSDNVFRISSDQQDLLCTLDFTVDKLIRVGAGVQMGCALTSFCEAFGITSDKIKAGETILGVTGTYTGEDDISL